MKTYAEAMANKPFDWFSWLDDRIAMVEISEDKIDSVIEKSGQWTTCACGNMCDAIPRWSREDANPSSGIRTSDGNYPMPGEPKDGELSRLGMKFYDEIQDKDWEDAKDTLIKIERRSKEVLVGLGIIKEEAK